MTPERAREIIRQQSQFPYWGNYQRFMTPDETELVRRLLREDENGNVSIASIVYGIAQRANV